MGRKAFNSEGPAPIGPYSRAVEMGNLVYFSGQTPIDPATGILVDGDIMVQTQQCFKNLFSILKSAGLTSDDVMKLNVYLIDMKDFEKMNEVYSKQFNYPPPARTTVGVRELPLGARVEIEMIAYRHKQ